MKPKLKKMFALVTAFMMALSIVTPNFAKADDETNKPVVSVTTDKDELNKGDEVTATVSLDTKNVQNINGNVTLTLRYDPEVLEPVAEPEIILTAPANSFVQVTNSITDSVSMYSLLYTDFGASHLEYKGEVFKVKYKVKDNAKAGSTTLKLDTTENAALQEQFEDYTTKPIDSTLVNKSVKVVSPLKSISFNGVADEATINLGATETLQVVYNPEDTTDDKTVTWNSTNTDAVTVDNGVVTAVGEGSSTVTATVGEKVATINYTVRIPLESITINGDETLSKNEEKTLTVTYNPTNTTDNKTVDWESSNPEIVSIDSTGKITGKKGGTAKITATVGNVKAEKEVKVVVPIESVSLSGDDSILKGETKRLTATINPEDTTDDKTITWSSDNENVLFVDQNGQIRGIKEGTANVKAVVAGKETTKQITVNEIHINSIAIDGDQEFEMIKNQTKNLSVTINPENTTDDKGVVWKTNNEEVARVDNDGKVTALKEGEATITATVGTNETSVKINVKEIHINSVVINELDDEFTRGDEFKFSATYTPENTTDENKTVEWSSSNADVGSIDQEGNFVALKEGTTKITAKIGNIKAEREVTVIENHVGNFKLLQEEGEVLNIGNTQKLVTVVNPENCTDAYTIKYSSSDEAIATVDENGNVTALKDGKVVITATLTTEYDEEFEDSIEINIPAKEVISNKAEDGTTNGAATQEATSPKTGDVTFVLVSVLMLGAATTLVVTKRRSVKQK